MLVQASRSTPLEARTFIEADARRRPGVIADLELEHYVRRLQHGYGIPSLTPDVGCRCGDTQCRLHAAIVDGREALEPRLSRPATVSTIGETPTEPPPALSR
jgi:hypothetical protein